MQPLEMIGWKQKKQEVFGMKIAETIQSLRKERGMSQEELAGEIGVSRQAVSKWESAQSVPDLEKIVQLSELFGVTTDYLIKGTQPPDVRVELDSGNSVNVKAVAVAATAINIVGLLATELLWYEWQNGIAILVGVVLLIIGCTVFGVGLCLSRGVDKRRMLYRFVRVNIWIVSFVPLAVGYSLIVQGWAVPYPMILGIGHWWGIGNFIGFWVLYAGVAAAVLVGLKGTKTENT